MKTARDILNEMWIVERPGRNGSFYTICPQCSHLRKGMKKRAPCLRVSVDARGVQYFCNHCDFKGGQFFDGGPPPIQPSASRKAATPKRPLGSHYR